MDTQSTETGWIADASSFGARLVLVRQRMGWSNVTEAARQCGLHAESWRLWEQGRMPSRLTTIAMVIATKTGCDYLWLVHGPQRGSMHPTHEKARSSGMRVIAAIGASTKPNRTIIGGPTSHSAVDHRPGRPVRQTRPVVGQSVRPHTPVAV